MGQVSSCNQVGTEAYGVVPSVDQSISRGSSLYQVFLCYLP